MDTRNILIEFADTIEFSENIEYVNMYLGYNRTTKKYFIVAHDICKGRESVDTYDEFDDKYEAKKTYCFAFIALQNLATDFKD